MFKSKHYGINLLSSSVDLSFLHDIQLVFTSVTLSNIIQKNFPEEYAERKSENEGLTNFGVDLMPLFVMDVVIPCQKFPLHIFEPRYRLMVSWSKMLILISKTAYCLLKISPRAFRTICGKVLL